MKKLITAVLVCLYFSGCTQTNSTVTVNNKQHVGGSCEGCEAIFESPVSFDQLDHIDTLPDFEWQKEKMLLTGIVFHADGKTPAKDVVLYVYHTNDKGIYPEDDNAVGWAKSHGYIRGWIKTNERGEYKFYSFRPASYPNSTQPQHVHITVKEPDKNEYYLDDFMFADDPYLPKANSNRQARGGNGVVQLKMSDGILKATRLIVLGKNIPGYPGN